jgi:DNA mismatch endonuclease (patch repair protein)
MADIITIEQRSWLMSQIKEKNTKPEIAIRKLLHSKGFRFRIHDKRLAGKPDLLLPKYKTVIFIHGCFWHQHPGCSVSHMPKSNIEYWASKLGKNIIRDKKNKKELKKAGWKVIVIWECDIKKHPIKTLNKLVSSIID